MIKFFRNIPRQFKEAYHAVARNLAMALSSASAVTVTLILIAIFVVVAVNVKGFTDSLEGDVKIHVKIDDAVKDEEISNLQTAIYKIDGVKKITYSDKDSELDALIEEYGDEGKVFEIYRGETNPLKRAFIVEVDDGNDIDEIASAISVIPGILTALYGGKSILTMMEAFSTIRSGIFIGIIVLSSLAIFLISNTIKLTINARKHEIDIMRLVGASNGYIRTPFVIEGIFIGIIGSIVPIIAVAYGYNYLYDATGGVFFSQLFPLVNPDPFTYEISLLLIIISVVVGLVGSYISVSRFLWWKR